MPGEFSQSFALRNGTHLASLGGSFSRDRKGFANKISFSSAASLLRGLVCSTKPENLGLGVLQDENPAHDGMPGSTSQAISAFPLPGEAHREEMEEEGEEELKVGAPRAVPEALGCPAPSGSQLSPPPHSLFHREHPSSPQTELLPWQMVPPGVREAPDALLPNFLASPMLLRPEPPDPSLASHSAWVVISLWCHMSFPK